VRNRDKHLAGRAAVRDFLRGKWEKELDYKLRKYCALRCCESDSCSSGDAKSQTR
jgi:nuclear transport factor 2 (NTF2) superfamily protein